MPISVLPPAVSAKIAAGEVIERPASALKELVENALDAGATDIAVELQNGGTRMVRVRDNGCGLPPEEAVLAFERYATSKIAHADDLLRVTTLGFRGEALPSIAAVAEVSLLTRAAGAIGGYAVRLSNGKLLEQGPQGAPPGTTVTVRDLFRDFPARRKFLRSDASETSQCAAVVAHYALARPDVRFSLKADNRMLLQTGGTGVLRDAVAGVWGHETASALLALPESGGGPDGIAVDGLAGPPGITRPTRGHIALFVNGRWVQHRSLSFAIEEAYPGLLMTGRHPVAVLHIAVQPDELDVNVHPRKLEVRFRQEGQVFAAVQRTVRHTLTAADPRTLLQRSPNFAGYGPGDQLSSQPSLTLSLSQREREDPSPSSVPGAPSTGRADTANPVSDRSAEMLPTQSSALSPQSSASQSSVPGSEPSPPDQRLPLLRVVGQVNNTYVIAEGPSGMYLVDQHAAHERVVFERVQQRLERQQWDQQGLLEPRLIEVPVEDLPLLLEAREDLARYGFSFEPFGLRQLVFRSLPYGVRAAEVERLLSEVAAGLRARDARQDRVAATIACHSAVRAGDPLTLPEMRTLLEDLEACGAPQTCPHGRPTMLHLSASMLEQQFGRRG